MPQYTVTMSPVATANAPAHTPLLANASIPKGIGTGQVSALGAEGVAVKRSDTLESIYQQLNTPSLMSSER